MQRSFATVVLVVLCVTTCLTVNPGFRAVITNHALNYVNKIGGPLIVEVFSQMQLPNITGEKLDFDYWLTNIKQGEFHLGNSSLTTSESLGLIVQASGLSGNLTADWRYQLHSWPHFPDDNGTCDITISGMSLSVSVMLGNDTRGRPTLTLTGCSLDISKITVNFHGGASWLYNLFDTLIADEIKSQVKSQVCGIVEDKITSENKNLSTLPMMYNLTNVSEVSYKFVKSPKFTSTYIESDNQGEVYIIAKPVEAPFTPPPLPPVSATSRMVYIWLTDYVLNTAGWAYYKAGLLKFNVTPNMVPKSSPIQLNTSSFIHLIPELPEKFPNMAMTLNLSVADAPRVNFITKGINVSGTARIKFYVLSGTKDGASGSTLAFTLQAVLYAEGQVRVTLNKTTGDQVIKGQLNQLKTDLSVVNTTIGKFSLTELQNAIDLIYKIFVIPGVNHYGEIGYPIPVIEMLIKLSNTSISLEKGYAVLSTDLGLNS